LPRSGKGEFRSRPVARATQGTRRAAQQGAPFFGNFLLGKQKKVTGRRAAPANLQLICRYQRN
jgi:hypothetical protein